MNVYLPEHQAQQRQQIEALRVNLAVKFFSEAVSKESTDFTAKATQAVQASDAILRALGMLSPSIRDNGQP